MSKRIIFDYYIDNARLDHVCIKNKQKKVLIVPFYIGLYSKDGFYNATTETREERDEFFSMMISLFIMSGGNDCITGLPQYVPYFAFMQNHRPGHNNMNIGIFSTILMFQNMLGVNVLDKFMGFSTGEFDYIKTNLYDEYLKLETSLDDTEEIEFKKEYLIMSIRKYCNLHFIINLLVSTNSSEEKTNSFYYTKYMNLVRILHTGSYPSLFFDRIINNSFEEFDNETDVWKLTSYKYIPFYLNCKRKINYKEIFEYLSPDSIKEKITKINQV